MKLESEGKFADDTWPSGFDHFELFLGSLRSDTVGEFLMNAALLGK